MPDPRLRRSTMRVTAAGASICESESHELHSRRATMSSHSRPSPAPPSPPSLFRNTVTCRANWPIETRLAGITATHRSIDRSIDMRERTDVIAVANRSPSRFPPPPPDSFVTTIMRIRMRNALLKRTFASPTLPPIDAQRFHRNALASGDNHS